MNTIENNRRFAGILRLILFSLVASFSIATTRAVCAQALVPGDIVIATQIGPTANKDFGLVLVDPANGNRTILSDNTTGTGPDFLQPEGVAIEPDGSLLVTDYLQHAVFRVDPATGDRTVVSGGGTGTGPGMGDPYGIVEAAGTIYVAVVNGEVLAVDPLTGNRTDFYPQPIGSVAVTPTGLAVQGQNILVANYYFGSLVSVDLSTGAGQFVGGAQSTYPEYMPDVALGHDGTIYISAQGQAGNRTAGVYSLNLQTNLYSPVSNASVGIGPQMGSMGPTGIATESYGSIILNEASLNAVLSIDPVTGYRLILSDATHGTGPLITAPQGVLVIPAVPEPSTLILAALGLALLTWRSRR